jgi:putative MATE family efflux protein
VAISISIFGALLITFRIVNLLGATDSVAPYAIEYGRIIFLGAITSTGYSAIVRADGNVRYSTALWVIPVGVNVVLSWLFVMVLQMGAGGAALATVIGQAVSAGDELLLLLLQAKQRTYDVKALYFKPDKAIIGEVLLIGLPSFLKSISASIVVILTNNLLRTLGGDSALSVFAIVGRLYGALGIPQSGIVQGMQPLVGYNFGLARIDRVRRTLTLALRTTVVYGLIVGGLCWLIPGALIALLTQEPAILAEGQTALRWLSLAYPLGGVAIVVAAYFQSLGKARQALLLTLGGMLLVKIPVLLLASRLFGLNGIWAAEAISELILCAFSWRLLKSNQERALLEWAVEQT